MMARRLLSSANHLFSSSIGGRTNGWNCARKEQPVSYSKVASSDNGDIEANAPKPGQWLTLPPFISRVNVGELGRELMGTPPAARSDMTALKWVKHCCPDIPHSLVQKLFRLRQIRMECVNPLDSLSQRKQEKHRVQLKRISAKEIMNPGTKIYLPVTVHEIKASKKDVSVQRRILESDADTIKYIRSLELYKDPAIIVLNKPPGLPVQGGPGIQTSMDVLAATALSYDYTDSPRLGHRLDKETSGILVMGRTRESAALLHSLFREKTAAASSTEDITHCRRRLKRRYWALVIGIPKQKQGRIAAPLAKVVCDNGKSERIIIADDSRTNLAQDAVTDYRVLGPSVHGCTWLELCPLTGRKHQLRVHCAEALGTPIVGDYKYGWSVHRSWRQMPRVDIDPQVWEQIKTITPYRLNMEKGSILGKVPLLHLHCRKLTLPNVAKALEQSDNVNQKLSDQDMLQFVAPLSPHMEISWNITSLCRV